MLGGLIVFVRNFFSHTMIYLWIQIQHIHFNNILDTKLLYLIAVPIYAWSARNLFNISIIWSFKKSTSNNREEHTHKVINKTFNLFPKYFYIDRYTIHVSSYILMFINRCFSHQFNHQIRHSEQSHAHKSADQYYYFPE